MKTLICNKPYDMQYIERSKPEIKDEEVLIKVKAVGICGTDIHAFTGKQPFFSYPRVFGHEICGEVVQVGTDCQTAKIGDRISVIPAISCKQCAACKSGKPNCCENISLYGVHQDGGFCEYLAVYEDNTIIVPDSLSDIAAAFTECFAIGAHAVRRSRIKAGENVLIIGAGPIGLGTAAIAKSDGANVVIADIDAQRLKHAEKTLAIATINPKDDHYLDELKMHFNGELADVVFDITGNKASMNKSVDLICHGGRIVFVGLYIGDLVLDDPTFHKKETTLIASRNATRQDFEKVIRLYASGDLFEDILLSHQYPFTMIGHSYGKDIVENHDLIKAAIVF